MNFGLALSGNSSHDNLIVELSNELKKYFQNKFYGTDLEDLVIGIICVSPEFDQFFKTSKPKYTKEKKTVAAHGISFEIQNSFTYDIKLDYEKVVSLTEDEIVDYLYNELKESIGIIEKHSSKLGDFELEGFRNDLDLFISNYNSNSHSTSDN